MPLKIKFVGAMRHLSGRTQFVINYQAGLSIRQLISNVTQEFPALSNTFCDRELNDSRSNSLILINGREISILAGLETILCDGDEIVFVPVVHGG